MKIEFDDDIGYERFPEVFQAAEGCPFVRQHDGLLIEKDEWTFGSRRYFFDYEDKKVTVSDYCGSMTTLSVDEIKLIHRLARDLGWLYE